MKYLKLLFILLFCLLLINCQDDSSDDSSTNESEATEDSTTDTPTIPDENSDDFILLTSYAFKGHFYKDADVLAFPLYDNFLQTGAHFLGGTKTDLGYWEVPAQIGAIFTEAKIEGLAYNERYGGNGVQKVKSIFYTASNDRNINALTTIAVDVIRWVYDNQEIKDNDQAIIDAELLVADIFGFGVMAPFASIGLNDGNLDAAKLLVASSVILQARSNTSDFMTEIAQAIISGDTAAIRAELAANMAILPILIVNEHQKTKYAEFEEVWNYPPMHIAANFPDYYEDLLNRDPVVQGSSNLNITSNCQFDQSTKNLFAVPFRPEEWIETSKYLALNFPNDSNISIWTKDDSGTYPKPGTELLVFEELQENFFPTLTYNGLLGDNHGILPDTDLYYVIHRDQNFTLSGVCGDVLPFGKVLFCEDNDQSSNICETWEGGTNLTRFFNRFAIQSYGVN